MLFHRFGYEKTSMDDIARTAHKAKGSLYYHFPSKEHLFCAVIESEIEKLEEGLTPIIEDSSLTEIDRIEQYIIRRMELMDKAYTYHETLRKEFMMYSTKSEEVEKLLECERKGEIYKPRTLVVPSELLAAAEQAERAVKVAEAAKKEADASAAASGERDFMAGSKKAERI